MRIISQIVEIPNNHKPDVEYIEKELGKLKINPIRWAVVNVSDKIYKISVANLIK